jgi:YVTN family beta-propeller protein
VTNSESDSVSVIDLARLQKIVDVPTGRGPRSIAYSPLSQMVYAAHKDGEVAVIDAKKFAKVATMKLDAGLRQIRIAPGGRRGFAANPTANRIYIFDTASNRVIHRAAIDGGPDQVAFSDSIAYVHRLESEIVRMIPLDSIGAAGQELQTIDFPAGRYALGLTDHPSPADSIVPAPGEPAVLVSNSADKAIYFYKEGMAAPMGSFSNYSHQPRAVLVVDHSLKQRSPGVFEAVAQLPKPGPYGLALFLNSPRMAQCFDGIHIDPNAELEAKRSARVADIEPLFETRNPTAGQPIELRFRVLDHETKQPKMGIRDLRVLVYHASGTWQWREWAAGKDAGIYTVQVTLPRAGAYHVTLECPSLGVGYNKAPDVIIEARE